MNEATHTVINRRSALLGVLASPVALAAPAALATPGEHPDALLLVLGRQLDAAEEVWRAALPEYQAAAKARSRAFKEHAAEFRAVARDDQAWTRLYRQVAGDADCCITKWNHFLESEVDPVHERIMATPVFTIDGLAVKARAVRFAFTCMAQTPDDLGSPEEALLTLVDDLLAMQAAQ